MIQGCREIDFMYLYHGQGQHGWMDVHEVRIGKKIRGQGQGERLQLIFLIQCCTDANKRG